MTCARALIAVVIALIAILPAAAEKIYKQQLPDGSVVYADHRIKGAKLLYQVEMPEAPAPVARADAPVSNAEASALDKRLRERASALDRAQRDVVIAERALEEAKHKLDVGKELLPGELQSSATGGTRVLPEYYDRIKRLEENVAQAQARLERVYSERNQLR